jgi:hypothetical protein
MCHFKSWYFDDNGYVIECTECSCLRVCFGSTMLNLQKENYYAFYNLVCTKKETHIPMHDENTKCIVLVTPSRSVQIILNEKELNDLYYMLQHADTEIKTQQLLNLFSAENQ